MTDRLGQDILSIARTRVGQRYDFGATVPKDNPDWSGPWDCAEFASWCVWQAYQIPFGLRPRSAATGDAYSGYWHDDANEPGVGIPWQAALSIPGAILVRKPRSSGIGHVAISLGTGTETIEARSKRQGVGIFGGAETRQWDIGVLLPGVEYPEAESALASPAATLTAMVSRRTPALGTNLFAYRSPRMRGPEIMAIQRALALRGVDPGPIDGDFGRLTAAAVASFQAEADIEADGIVGPVTAAALGLPFPIAGDGEAKSWQILIEREMAPFVPQTATLAGSGDSLRLNKVERRGKRLTAHLSDGSRIDVGSDVEYSDDLHRRGLAHLGSLDRIAEIGRYDPADYRAEHGHWADFVAPTIEAESGGYFGRVNSYDRAAFTFGAIQSAAHTPGENLIALLRRLIALEGAAFYFPELAMVDGRLHHVGNQVDLEMEAEVRRPNGRMERQLSHFMNFLNPDPRKVDEAEISAAARLMAWTRDVPEARHAQVSLIVEKAKRLLGETRRKVPAFVAGDWRVALWVFDIRYQGRGTHRQIAAALSGGSPLEALAAIGTSYAERRKTVRDAVARIEGAGHLAGFAP